MSENTLKNEGFFIRDYGETTLVNGFKTNEPKPERKNDDLEILERSEIMDFLKELRNDGQIRWSDKKGGSLPTIRDPGGNLESVFIKPKEEKEVDYEPARIYISTNPNRPFISFLFDGSKEQQRDGSWLIKCSEARFGVKDRKVCAFGFGTTYRSIGNDIVGGIVDAVVNPNFKGIYLNKK